MHRKQLGVWHQDHNAALIVRFLPTVKIASSIRKLISTANLEQSQVLRTVSYVCQADIWGCVHMSRMSDQPVATEKL